MLFRSQRKQIREQSVAAAAQNLDDVQKAIQLYRRFQAENSQYRGRTPDLTDVNNVTDFTNWLAYNVGSGAAQMAPIMLAAVASGGTGVVGSSTLMSMQETMDNRVKYLEKQPYWKYLSDDQKANKIIDYLTKTGDANMLVSVVSGALDLAGVTGSIVKRKLDRKSTRLNSSH